MRRVLLSALLGGLLAPTAAAQPVLYDFYADWCGPCREMAATVNALAAEGYAVQRVNVDRQPELAAKYGVQGIPCFVWLESGREVDRVTGVVALERLKWHGKPATVERERIKSQPQPHPAWRYERPEGHRASVVRIYCQDSARSRSIGSGTLVRWNGRLVVLTARHVVRNAIKITVELCTRKTHEARVLQTDPTWDCAVLELMGRPVGVPVAKLELGPSATQEDGDSLESCGYGPDGKLAVNSGLFVGYRRSSAAPKGPDDWMVISGHARPGDSGGPVFNARGRLVGVLWGTDGEEVVCVQAGRVHLVLEAAVPARAYQQRACRCDGRSPTPPMPEPADLDDLPVAQPVASQQPALPWRKGIEEREKSTAGAIREIGGKLDAIAARPAPVCPVPQPDPRVDEALRLGQEANAKLDALTAALAEKAKQEAAKEAEKPKLDLAQQKMDDLLHKLPIQGPVTQALEKKIESGDGVLESPFAKHLAAILAVVFVIGVGTWIAISQHRKAGTKTIAENLVDKVATATAGTPLGTATNLLDKGINDLGQRLRDLDAKIDAKVSGLQQQVTQTALATPAPSQAQPAAPAVPVQPAAKS